MLFFLSGRSQDLNSNLWELDVRHERCGNKLLHLLPHNEGLERFIRAYLNLDAFSGAAGKAEKDA